MKSRPVEDILTEEGLATCDALGESHEQALKRVESLANRTDQGYATLYFDYITNGMYSRNVLPHKVRQLCAVAALTILRYDAELEGHIRRALRFNSVEEVREVILQMSVYGGVPITHNGLRILEKVLGENKTK